MPDLSVQEQKRAEKYWPDMVQTLAWVMETKRDINRVDCSFVERVAYISY